MQDNSVLACNESVLFDLQLGTIGGPPLMDPYMDPFMDPQTFRIFWIACMPVQKHPSTGQTDVTDKNSLIISHRWRSEIIIRKTKIYQRGVERNI